MLSTNFMLSLLVASLILTLLVIDGVEINPGLTTQLLRQV